VWNHNPKFRTFSTSTFHTGNGDPHWDAADESFVIHRRERERERESEREEKRRKRGWECSL
jgi:hypothetical protein